MMRLPSWFSIVFNDWLQWLTRYVTMIAKVLCYRLPPLDSLVKLEALNNMVHEMQFRYSEGDESPVRRSLGESWHTQLTHSMAGGQLSGRLWKMCPGVKDSNGQGWEDIWMDWAMASTLSLSTYSAIKQLDQGHNQYVEALRRIDFRFRNWSARIHNSEPTTSFTNNNGPTRNVWEHVDLV